MFQDPPAKLRWPRSQRFALSETGIAAQAAYMSSIVAARAEGGRISFDAARASWAAEFHLQPDDGLYLGEIQGGSRQLAEIVAALETCGKNRKDAIAALERLVDAGLISTRES